MEFLFLDRSGFEKLLLLLLRDKEIILPIERFGINGKLF